MRKTTFRKGDIVTHIKGSSLREITRIAYTSDEDDEPIIWFDGDENPCRSAGWRVVVPMPVVGDVIRHTHKAYIGRVTSVKTDGRGKPCGITFHAQHGADIGKPLDKHIQRVVAAEDVFDIGERVEDHEGHAGEVVSVELAPYGEGTPLLVGVDFDDEHYNRMPNAKSMSIGALKRTDEPKPTPPYAEGDVVMSPNRAKRKVLTCRLNGGKWTAEVYGEDDSGDVLSVVVDNTHKATWAKDDLARIDGGVHRVLDVLSNNVLRGVTHLDIAAFSCGVAVEDAEHVLEGYDGDVWGEGRPKFKPGTYVRCIQPMTGSDTLVMGGVYRTLYGGKPGLVCLQGLSASFKPERFEKWRPEVGDVVRHNGHLLRVDELDDKKPIKAGGFLTEDPNAICDEDNFLGLLAADVTPVLATDADYGAAPFTWGDYFNDDIPAPEEEPPFWGAEMLRKMLDGKTLTIKIEARVDADRR